MKQEYEGLKKGLQSLAAAQERAAAEAPDADDIATLQLEGRAINVAFYRAAPEAPVVFAFHGGGFLIGSFVADAPLFREMSSRMGVTIISVAYRKAPEHVFPTALYDCYDAMAYVIEHADELAICADDVSVYGYSAGGNLAAAVCLLDAQRGGQLGIRYQYLSYPYLDLATSPAAKGHAVGERPVYEIFRDLYCEGHDATDPLASPVYASEKLLAQMPPAIIALAERDPLMAEGARYACRLRAAGVPVKLMMASNMAHGYSELAFQAETPYMDELSRTQLRDGSMLASCLQTIDFMAAGFDALR